MRTKTILSKKSLINKIPQSLWNEPKIFDQKLKREQKKLANTPIKSIIDHPDLVQISNNEMASWVCIAIGNPEATGWELFQIAKILDIYPFFIFLLACCMGNLSMLKALFKEVNEDVSRDFIENVSFLGYRQAAINGHLSILLYLESKSPQAIRSMIQVTINEPAYLVALESNPTFHTLFHFKEKEPHLTKAKIFEAYAQAVNRSNLHLMYRIEQIAPEWIEDFIKNQNYRLYRSAVEGENLTVMKHLEEQLTDEINTVRSSMS